jgi:6-pyruvoyltetrahydropterin/6-carboxytetrahydropterin synthase
MDCFKVRVGKDSLGFAASHFITFEGSKCERLHGHNFRVAVDLEGPLNGDSLVFDFVVLRSMLQEILRELDHRVLLPLCSSRLQLAHDAKAVSIRCGAKRWVFPREDCALLPLENTTAELLAKWIGSRLMGEMKRRASLPLALPRIVRVEVEESPGEAAFHESHDGAPGPLTSGSGGVDFAL